jgi:hypothetical protein
VRRLVLKTVSTVRYYGFHPVLIARSFLARLRARRLQRHLRTEYASLVAEPTRAASLRVPKVDLPPASELPAELRDAAESLRHEAEAVCAHQMDYLGSGLVDLGSQIDWNRDFKSGYRWRSDFYLDVQVTRLDDDSDAKVPWELSRGHQLLTLARAACLYQDERFAGELEAQVSSWLDENPTGYGINWVTPMEIAFRAINWIWAIGTLESFRPLEATLRARVTRSLQAHGRHIALNLEGSPLLRGNHYLADIVGLLVLSVFLPDDPDARAWADLSRRGLEREIGSQVYDDGVGFEASLPYHGLSLEMFLVAWHAARLDGRPLSRRYRDRLLRMREVSRAVRHPDGRSPVFGDQDSGRLLPAGFARPATHDNLLDLGSAVLGLPRALPGAPHEEVAWTLGLTQWRELAQSPVDETPVTTAFPDGGLYVLQGGGAHMVVRWGGVGQNGNGGHAHNDLSSYELSYDEPIVIDGGSYLYTADLEARNEFRSAGAHNVLVLDGLDMNPFPHAEPFRMPAHARFNVEEWHTTPQQTVLTGSHDGFRRRGSPARVRRRITLDRNQGIIHVSDEATGGRGQHRIQSLLHLSPRCDAAQIDGGVVIVTGRAGHQRIEFDGSASVEVAQEWVSSQYGVRERSPLIRASLTTELPATISYRICPA